jgi:lipoic acid synthetase
VYETLLDLARVGVDWVTIGQYLQPTAKKFGVVEWIHPNVFKEYETMAKELKIRKVLAGPFVRSSYIE